MKKLIITIDGPAAAGKGTIAFLLARRYSLLDIDSGALFRAITWLANKKAVPLDADHEDTLAGLAKDHRIKLLAGEDVASRMGVEVDGQDISREIRSEELSKMVPNVSLLPKVRDVILQWQHELAATAERGVVTEGRDTGTAVFPDATIKFFLTASAEERAMRRHMEFKSRGKGISFEEVYSDLLARDRADMERVHAPLTKPDDAVVIDSTGMEVEQVIHKFVKAIEERTGIRSEAI